MSVDPRLLRLKPLVEAKFNAERAALAPVLAAEARCRGGLRQLADATDALRQAAQTPGPMQVIGADMALQAALERSRAAQQMDLARILVQKSDGLQRLRRAHGRSDAVERVLTRQQQADRATRAERAQTAALAPWMVADQTS